MRLFDRAEAGGAGGARLSARSALQSGCNEALRGCDPNAVPVPFVLRPAEGSGGEDSVQPVLFGEKSVDEGGGAR